MTRWLVTGAAGMLGRDLTDLLGARGEDFTPLARADLDITDPAAVAKAVSSVKPDVVVNCAAWTAVDAAEDHEEDALAINGQGAANLAAACADAGALLVHPSTDYVFDGRATTPYAEGAPTDPAGAYGRTKLAGERSVRAALPHASYIVRTAWLYGAHGKNFVKTMLRLARNGTAPGVVADQHGQPTWTADVATQIYALIATGPPRPASTTRQAPARQPGSASPRRSSPSTTRRHLKLRTMVKVKKRIQNEFCCLPGPSLQPTTRRRRNALPTAS